MRPRLLPQIPTPRLAAATAGIITMTSDPDSTIARYMTSVSQAPKLSRERELELFRGWRDSGDQCAKDALVRANLRYVVAIALKYRRYGIPVSELIAEGNVGIVNALAKFEPERNLRFVTYAAYWIRAYILEYIVRSWSVVGTGSGALRSKTFFKLRRERVRITNLVGEGERAEELLAERFKTSREQVVAMLDRLARRDVSLDSRVSDNGVTALVDTLASSDASQEEGYASSQWQWRLYNAVQMALEILDRRERYIVEQRLMSEFGSERSLAEIGRNLGISRERARQLETRAKRKLKAQIVEILGTADVEDLQRDHAA